MKQNDALYHSVYQNAKIASQSIEALLPKVESKRLHQQLENQRETYDLLAREAKDALRIQNKKPKEKLASKWSIPIMSSVNTLLDQSSSHIAEMMINGSTMGIVEMNKELRRHPGESHASHLGKALMDYEQKNIDTLGEYLK